MNPHENRHINTAHPTDVRVYVPGSAYFDTTQINLSTVRLGGASPIFSQFKKINHDQYPDRVFFFRGSDIHLPSGITQATLSGTLNDGTPFSGTEGVYNKTDAMYSPGAVAGRDARQARLGFGATNPPPTPLLLKLAPHKFDQALEHLARDPMEPFVPNTTVRIATRADRAVKAASVSASPATASGSGGMSLDLAGSPVAAHARGAGAAASPGGTVAIPRRVITQAAAPVTVKVPRGRSLAIPEVPASPSRGPRHLLSAVMNRSGLSRAAS